MNKTRIVGKLKPPSKVANNKLPSMPVSKDICTDIPVPASTGTHPRIGAVRSRRSKSFGVSTAKATMNMQNRIKSSTLSSNLAMKRTVVAPNMVRAPTSRLNTAPIARTAPAIQSKVAVKRPASVEMAKLAVSAPKLSKFDYKGRFLLLEEKYKMLQKEHKDTKERNTILEEEHESLQSTCERQSALIEDLQQYKLQTEDLVTIHKETEEKLNKAQKHMQDLQINWDKTTQKLQKLQENFDTLHEAIEQTKSDKALLKSDLKDARYLIENLKQEIREHEDLRRRLHNDVQDLKGNIRVFCRVRPMKPDEEDGLPCKIDFFDDTTLELKKSKESMMGREKCEARLEFTFDRVFPGESSQAEVFEDLSQLVQSTLDGYNVCVFAYGQTGSGKTYTMLGNQDNLGMIPRSIELLFTKIERMQELGWSYKVQVNFLEIYNETIKDLLNPDCKKVHEIMHNEGKGAVVTNMCTETVSTAMILKKLMIRAHSNRAMATTNFNLHSSRSHAVTKIIVKGSYEHTELSGSLSLVDLAGSESAKNSERMAETKSINKSLSALGTVMLALHNKDKHVPYRNSKLTYLLQGSLGGNSKTLMFVNISPLEDCYAESVNSLRFASKVKEVKTGSKRNRMINKF